MADYSISIIIPAYNVEEYLLEALGSIKSQTQYPDEVILIDDGSTDNTLNIAESYEFPFPFRVLSVNNGGQGRARNIGTELASSEYVYYFDSDDLLDESFIENIKQEIKFHNKPDIVLFSGQAFYDEGYKQLKPMNYSRGFNKYFKSRSDFLEYSDKYNSLFCQPCCYISKRKLWEGKGLLFPNNYLEDDAIFFPLLFKCKSYKVIDSIYFFRRIRYESTMTIKPNIKHVLGAINCIYSILDLLNESNNNIEIRVLRKRLVSYSLAYTSLAKEAKIKVSLKVLGLVVKESKSALFIPKALLVATGINNTKLVSYLNKRLKNILN